MINEVITAPFRYNGLQFSMDHSFDCKRRLLAFGKRSRLKQNLLENGEGDFAASIRWIESQEERQFAKWLPRHQDPDVRKWAGKVTFKEAIAKGHPLGYRARRWEAWVQLTNVEWWLAGDTIKGLAKDPKFNHWIWCECGCKRPTTGEKYISGHQYLVKAQIAMHDAERRATLILRLRQEIDTLDDARDERQKLLEEAEGWT